MNGWRAVVAGLVTAIALSQAPARADSADDFFEILQTAIALGPDAADIASLRRGYAQTNAYTGSSRLEAMQIEAQAANAADPFAGLAPEGVTTAILLDFPLLETQSIAFAYYSATTPDDSDQIGFHAGWYRAIMAGILAGAVTSGTTTTYTVLSVTEEYEVLVDLDLVPQVQSLTTIDGIPYDVFVIDGREIRFDISAFFGKF